MSQRMSQTVAILRMPESSDADVDTRITCGLRQLSSLPVHVSNARDL